MSTQSDQKPLVNVHVHIFLARDVPSFVGRKMIPSPLHRLMHLPTILSIYKWWLASTDPGGWIFQLRSLRHRFVSWAATSHMGYFFFNCLLVFLVINSVAILLTALNISNTWLNDAASRVSALLLLKKGPVLVQVFTVMLTFLISSKTRGILMNVVNRVWRLPDSSTIRFLQRYLHIVALARYKQQEDIFHRLHKMYPTDARFVILPMDMAYMKAGSARPYYRQLQIINRMANDTRPNYDRVIPFLHCDPRRMAGIEEPTPKKIIKRKKRVPTLPYFISVLDGSLVTPFWDWEVKNKSIEIRESIARYCLEEHNNLQGSGKFKGIKIYPALGYYPFDPELLPLWLYCIENGIPVLTHCTVGTIYYRGRLRSEWFYHPVFTLADGSPMPMHAKNNYELQRNFTHPLNYLVLLDDAVLQQYLRSLAGKLEEKKYIKLIAAFYSMNESEVTDLFRVFLEDQDIEEFFSELATQGEFKSLRELKINLAHYGGEEEWSRYLERDRHEASFELNEMPDFGIQMLGEQSSGATLLHKPAQLWPEEEWYSIISSLMLQYPNVYADISYIIHSAEIKPLLRQSLRNEKLSRKILFGTDFYVVRNHKSEKAILAELYNDLGEKEINLIGKENPHKYLEGE